MTQGDFSTVFGEDAPPFKVERNRALLLFRGSSIQDLGIHVEIIAISIGTNDVEKIRIAVRLMERP